MVKKQINVVNLSDIKPIEDTKEDIDKENDERTNIQQAIEAEERQQEETPEPKPKRKTPTKKTKVVEEPIEPVAEPDIQTKDTTPKQKEKKIKTVELHKCDKCNKELTQRALRYTHPRYCSGREVNRNEEPVKRQTKPTTIINNVVEITPDIIENHLRKVKENKLKERQDKISKLISKIA